MDLNQAVRNARPTPAGVESDADPLAAANRLAWTLRHIDPRRSRQLAQRCLLQATAGPDNDRGEPEQFLAASRTLAALELDAGGLDEAFTRCSELLAALEEWPSPELKSSVLTILARVHYCTGDVEPALQVVTEAVDTARSCGSVRGESRALSTLGLVYGLMREAEHARAAFDQSLTVARASGDILGAAVALNNQAWVAGELGEAERGLVAAQHALEVMGQADLGGVEAAVLETTGSLYHKLGEPDRATWYLERALQAAERTSNRLVQAQALIGLGEVAADADDPQAVRLLDSALAVAVEAGAFVETSAAHRALSDWFAKAGDHDRALSHFRRYHEGWEEVLTGNATLAARMLTARYETDRVRAEKRLEQGRSRALEDEIARRHEIESELRLAHAQAVEARREAVLARDEADRNSQAKSEFLANMGHDLRTPLNGILGFAQILRRRGSLDDRDQQAVDVIHRSGRHLLQMVNDLLDLARIEAKNIAIRPQAVEVRQFIDDLLAIVGPRAAEQGVELSEIFADRVPRVVWIDPNRATQVLLNVVDNALKFTPAKGRVTLTVSGVKTAPGRPRGLVVAVVDSGPGIEPEEVDRIFDRFERGRSHGGGEAGVGLGLTIAKQLSDLMGGSLRVESQVDVGSIFILELPSLAGSVDMVTEELEVPAADLAESVRGATALVVDDDPASRAVLVAILVDAGLRTVEARTGEEALVVFDTTEPDIVFMDVWMPGMGGLQAAAKVRERGPLGTVPIVAVTASPFDLDSDENAQPRIDAHLLKPIDAEAVISSVARLVVAKRTEI